jgi:hypothetical protein
MHTYSSFFRCHPAGSPRLCMMYSSARRPLPACYERHYQGLDTTGQDGSTCSPHLVVLIATRSRSIFRRRYNTKTSRRRLKKELLSHTSVTKCRWDRQPLFSNWASRTHHSPSFVLSRVNVSEKNCVRK